MYWSGDEGVRNEAVVGAMTRYRFEESMRHVHLADNNKLRKNKYSKVRPLFDQLNEIFQNHFLGTRDFSIDERMGPCFGKHRANGKPIRYVYKMWV